MPIPNYRVVLSFDAERKVFMARAPELEHCMAEGATRGEAVARLEQEIEALVANLKDHSKGPPPSVDETTWSGELVTQVSKTLHRDLVWLARQEGIEVNQLVSELLASGLEGRRQGRRPQRQHPDAQPQEGNFREGREPYDRSRQGYGSRYHGIMDNSANFIEYVRGLETERGNGRPRGRDARPDRPGPGGPGGPGGDRRPQGGPGDRDRDRDRPRNDRNDRNDRGPKRGRYRPGGPPQQQKGGPAHEAAPQATTAPSGNTDSGSGQDS